MSVLPHVRQPVNVDPAAQDARQLNALALRGLVGMFNVERKLFCHRIERRRTGLSRHGLSHRYSAMALLGLQQLQEMEPHLPIEIDAAVASVLDDVSWIEGVGDFGLALWLASQCMPQRIEMLLRKMQPDVCLDEFTDARQGKTMELSWFLTGLCKASRATADSCFALEDVSAKTFRRLDENRTECGLFRHLCNDSWSGGLRGPIGTLADQTFSIYAMTLFAATFGIEEPLESAFECAQMLCSLQGHLGQWWWLYNAEKGKILSRYPVFAMQQHGLVPLALGKLQEASGGRFEAYIERGARWIYGVNELSEDLRCSSRSLIWRGILPRSKYAQYVAVARGFLGWPSLEMPPAALRVVYESRPFELGLILYSSARFGLPDALQETVHPSSSSSSCKIEGGDSADEPIFGVPQR